MLDLQKLKTFCVVAEKQNFTKAAVKLGYSQSNVTMQIQALERELGIALFERYRFSKSIVLTQAGRKTLQYAKRILKLVAETQAAVRDETTPLAAS